MKKILLPLLCCLVATSCLKESTLYVENYSDFASYVEGKLVTDRAYRFTVVENQSGTEGWKKEGERFFMHTYEYAPQRKDIEYKVCVIYYFEP